MNDATPQSLQFLGLRARPWPAWAAYGGRARASRPPVR